MVVTNSLTGGGAERSMNLACNELTRRGWPVALVPINSGPSDQVIPSCDVFPLERKWRDSWLGTFVAIRRFHLVVKMWKPDVIVLNCDLPEFFGATLFSRHNLVVIEHVNRPWITRIMFGRIIRRLLRLRQTKWAAVSSHLAIWPDSRNADAVIPNSILLSRTTTFKVPPMLQTSHVRRLIFIGRLAPQKRPEWLIEIGEKTNLGVEFIGEGSLREAMESVATTRSVDVNFRGRISDPWNLFEEGDLLIVPSEYEGDGLVVIEGMQHETPMLLADIPDFRRFKLPEENYCKSVGDFIYTINRFKEDISNLKVPKEITRQILASRTPETVGDVWEDFLYSI